MEIAVTLGVCLTALCSGWLMSQASRNAGPEPAQTQGEQQSGTLVALMLLAGFATIAVYIMGGVK
jgi:hypothetical protein